MSAAEWRAYFDDLRARAKDPVAALSPEDFRALAHLKLSHPDSRVQQASAGVDVGGERLDGADRGRRRDDPSQRKATGLQEHPELLSGPNPAAVGAVARQHDQVPGGGIPRRVRIGYLAPAGITHSIRSTPPLPATASQQRRKRRPPGN